MLSKNNTTVWPLFEEIRYQYVGHWKNMFNETISSFDGSLDRGEGTMYLQFYKGKYDDIYIQFKALNGNHIDGYYIDTVFNLTNTPFDFEKSVYDYTGYDTFTIASNLGASYVQKSYDVNFKINLLDKD